jgi:hypothetical protein
MESPAGGEKVVGIDEEEPHAKEIQCYVGDARALLSVERGWERERLEGQSSGSLET